MECKSFFFFVIMLPFFQSVVSEIGKTVILNMLLQKSDWGPRMEHLAWRWNKMFVIDAFQTNSGYMDTEFRAPPFAWIFQTELASSGYVYPQEMNMENIYFGLHPEAYSRNRLYFWPTTKQALANISFLFSNNKWRLQAAVSSLSLGRHEEELDITIYQGHCRWDFHHG